MWIQMLVVEKAGSLFDSQAVPLRVRVDEIVQSRVRYDTGKSSKRTLSCISRMNLIMFPRCVLALYWLSQCNQYLTLFKMCLRNTSTYFRRAINVNFVKLSICSKWLQVCRFENGLLRSHEGIFPSRDMWLLQDEGRSRIFRSQENFECRTLKLLSKKPVERFCI